MPPFPSHLVSTAWLAQQLGAPGLAVVDASWYLPMSGRDARGEYRAGHLPGAVYFDLDRLSASDTPLPHMLPTEAGFAAQVGALGIGNDSRVVVYDGSGNNLSAGRAWWMFRVFGHRAVALLDGGAPRWRAEGRRMEPGDVRPNTVSFTARLDLSRVRSQAEVRAALADGSAQVVDMRSAGRFSGVEPEPRPGLRSGHMPGAINLPFGSLVHADGTALSEDALRQRLAEAGLSLDQPIIATCGSGVSACTLLHALARLSHQSAALYDGSWTEWAGGDGPVQTQG